jgi:hypothetical protein
MMAHVDTLPSPAPLSPRRPPGVQLFTNAMIWGKASPVAIRPASRAWPIWWDSRNPTSLVSGLYR